MRNSLPTFERLQNLELTDSSDYCCDHIAKCISLCHSLTKLKIDEVKCYYTEDLLNTVQGLKNLKSLSMNCIEDHFTKNFFDYISYNLLELELLDLNDCYEISDSDLTSIKKLPKLKVLMIDSVDITGSEIRNLSTLKKLSCSGHSFKEDNVISLLRCASELEYLDISYNEKMTNTVIDVAIEETKKRINNIVLEIRVEKTSIVPDKIHKMSLLLNIVFV